MKATFSNAVLVLASFVWTAFAVDFPLPMAPTEKLLEETKVECMKNIKNCWLLAYFKPSELICGSDQATYGGECHLCSQILYKGFTITKLHDGPCKTASADQKES